MRCKRVDRKDLKRKLDELGAQVAALLAEQVRAAEEAAKEAAQSEEAVGQPVPPIAHTGFPLRAESPRPKTLAEAKAIVDAGKFR